MISGRLPWGLMGIMYSRDDRTALHDALVAAALRDPLLSGVAVCGSMAVAKEDIWSDLDLVLAIADSSCSDEVIASWTRSMVEEHGAVHHVDIASGRRVYRAFLLPSTLEADLNFVPADEFRPDGPKFRPLRGTPLPPGPAAPAGDAEHFIGMGWLYAEQARACLGRGGLWQAERMIARVRDQALALACLRHDLPAAYGASIDSLPPDVLEDFKDSVVRSIEVGEARRAHASAVALLCEEARLAGHASDKALLATLSALASVPSDPR
jgi:hypothetical protein